MLRSKIIGTGSYVPENILTNSQLEKMVNTNDDWILSRTGIKERRIVKKGETTSDLAVQAAKMAIDMAGINVSDIDLIIIATITPDMFFPSTACFVQTKLGANKCTAFDVSAACSGFIYALSVADSFLRTGNFKNALVIGAETLSNILDWEDRNTCVLFGDGAGAIVLTLQEGNSGLLDAALHADGSYWEILNVPAGGSVNPSTHETVEKRMHTIKMVGNETFKIAVKALEEVAREVLEKCNLKGEDVSLFIPHQANIRIISSTAKRLNVPMEKVYINIERYGNTSAASIPIALDEANRKGLLNEGDIILLDAFGGGLTWGAALIRW